MNNFNPDGIERANILARHIEAKVSDDGLKAFIYFKDFCVENPPSSDVPLKPSDIFLRDEVISRVRDSLVAERVWFGLDDKAVQKAANEWLAIGKNAEVVAALGIDRVNGNDAKIEIVYSPQKKVPQPKAAPQTKTAPQPKPAAAVVGAKPKDKEKDIDFRDKGFIVNIPAGTLIAKKIKATAGENGMTVRGEDIAAIAGKDIAFQKSELISERDGGDGCIYYELTKDGMLEKLSDSCAIIVDKKNIEGDIDYDKGNIFAWGSVDIKGSVKPNFSVRATGDVSVQTAVESALIEAAGSVNVAGGLFGKEGATRIRVGRNLKCLFIEHSTVKAGGGVVVLDSVVDSVIESGGNIEIMGKKGVVLTSSFFAGGAVKATLLGSQAEGRLSISVGHNPAIWLSVAKLKRDVNYLKIMLKKGRRMLALRHCDALDKRIMIRRSDQRKMALLMERSIRRKISGVLTGMSCQGLSPCVIVGRHIFANVRISIGPYHFISRDDMERGVFLLIPEKERIVFQRGG